MKRRHPASRKTLSLKTALRAVLTGFLTAITLVCFAGCSRLPARIPAPTEAFEGNAAPRATFVLDGLALKGNGIAALADGDRTKAAVFNCEDEEGEILADLGAVYRISRIDVYPASDGTYFGRLFPRSFGVYCSADGKQYTKVFTYDTVEGPDCVPVLEFSPVDARYVKFTFNEFVFENGESIAEIAEIEIISFFGEYQYPV